MTFSYLVALILLFVLAFLLLAWAAPRRYQIKVTRRIPATAERVWALLMDSAAWPTWYPELESSEHVSGPPAGEGQRRRIRFHHDGLPGEREETVTKADAPKLLVIQHGEETVGGKAVPWTEASHEFRLVPEGTSTALTGVFWFNGRGAIGRSLALLAIRKRHEKTMRKALANLEARVREGTAI